jgi:hypothetical protein
MKKLLFYIIFILLENHSYSQNDTIVIKEKFSKQSIADIIYLNTRQYIVGRIKDNLIKSFSNNYYKRSYHTYGGCPHDNFLGIGDDYYWDCYADSLFQKYFGIDTILIRCILNDSSEVYFKEYNGQDYKIMSVPFYFKLPEFNYYQNNELVHYTDPDRWESKEIIIPEYILRNDTCNFLHKSDLLKIVNMLGYNLDKIPEDCRQNGRNRKLIDDAYLVYDFVTKQWVWRFYIESKEIKYGLCEMMVPAIIIIGDCEKIFRRQFN